MDLHSSMDRFEEITLRYFTLTVVIYIPVWIDLKINLAKIFKQWYCIYIPVWIDLKSRISDLPLQIKWIYIPVWIDLKNSARIWLQAFTKIYIPVWIDLKFIKHLCFLHPLPYLHSSMDRFEEAIAKNMDNEEFNLHSSLDRFEAVARLSIKSAASVFTFQYG